MHYFGSGQKAKEKTFDSSNTPRSSNNSAHGKIDIKNLNTIDTNQKAKPESECCRHKNKKKMNFIYSQPPKKPNPRALYLEAIKPVIHSLKEEKK